MTAAWWTAVVLGAAHVSFVVIRQYLLHHIVWQSRQIFWMAPAGYLLLMMAAAIPVGLVTLALPPRAARPFPPIAFGTLGSFGILLLFPQVKPIASLLLAIGIGTQLGRLTIRPAVAVRLQRAGWAIGLILGLTAAGLLVAERRAVLVERGTPYLHQGVRPPNVLLLVWDTVRGSNLSLYGYRRQTTPRLEDWARGGSVFDWAFSTAPWTLPSHASMMTGIPSGDLTGNWSTPLAGGHRTLAEYFARRGYATGGFVDNLNYTHRFSGIGRGFAKYDEHRRSLAQILLSGTFLQLQRIRYLVWKVLPSRVRETLWDVDLIVTPPYWANARKYDHETSQAFLRWQEGLNGRPFFGFINYFSAHEYWSPPAFSPLFAGDSSEQAGYDRAIAYLDRELDRVLDSLRQRGVLDNTIVILTSDHGEQFGEHGLQQHGNSLYLPLLHVPLVIRYPARVPAGVRSDAPVSLRDLPRSIVSWAFPEDTGAFPGRSLVPDDPRLADDGDPGVLAEVRQNPSALAFEPVSRGDMISILDRRMHYILNGDGVEELYAYREDPAEAVNLIDAPGAQAARERLRAQVQAVLARRSASSAAARRAPDRRR